MVQLRSSHLVLMVLTAVSACSEQRTANLVEPQFAKPANSVSVASTVPSVGARGTTINVRVLGSGYASGFRALWALNGDTTYAATHVRTNSTTYVSANELIANITIAVDADLSLYDVVVVGNGKKGIGIEIFEITYAYNDLGAADIDAIRINNPGQIVFNRAGRGVVWDNGVERTLPLLSGTTGCHAWDINDAGVVVGDCGSRAVFWPAQAGGPQELGGEAARAINNNGDIVGISGGRAVAWMGGSKVDVGANIELWDINDSGIAVGQNFSSTNPSSLIWTRTSGVQVIYGNGTALGVSSDGVVVGRATPPGASQPLAFRWANGSIQFLGTLANGNESMAQQANSSGLVVGRSTTGVVRGSRVTVKCCTGYVWTAHTGMIVLNVPSGWSVPWAYDVNDSGWIVGITTSGDIARAVLWKPLF